MKERFELKFDDKNNLRTGSTVRNMKLLPGNGTTSTDAPLTATRSTAGLGNESVTAMLRRILCVSCV